MLLRRDALKAKRRFSAGAGIMRSQTTRSAALEDLPVSVRLKLAALWASFMFLYIYVDYFHLYMPGSLEDLLAGRVFVFDITQAYIVAGLTSVTIPAMMIFLSVALPAQAARWTNLGVATVYVPYTLFNLAGEAWIHMALAAALEVSLLVLVIRLAWRWPRIAP